MSGERIEELLCVMSDPLPSWSLPIFVCKDDGGYLAQSIIDGVDAEASALTRGEATVKCMAMMLRHFVNKETHNVP